MKYAIIKVTNGNFNIHAEGFEDNLNGAKVSYHDLCKLLWNDAETQTACIMITDENLDVVQGYKEFISKVQPEPESKPTES